MTAPNTDAIQQIVLTCETGAVPQGVIDTLLSDAESLLSTACDDDQRAANPSSVSQIPKPGARKSAIERFVGQEGKYRLSEGTYFDLAFNCLLTVAGLAGALALGNATVVGLAATLYLYRRQSADVDEWHALVIKTLRDGPSEGCSAELLHDLLPKRVQDRWTKAELESVLAGLRSVRLRSGKRAAFVDTDGNRWWVLNV